MCSQSTILNAHSLQIPHLLFVIKVIFCIEQQYFWCKTGELPLQLQEQTDRSMMSSGDKSCFRDGKWWIDCSQPRSVSLQYGPRSHGGHFPLMFALRLESSNAWRKLCCCAPGWSQLGRFPMLIRLATWNIVVQNVSFPPWAWCQRNKAAVCVNNDLIGLSLHTWFCRTWRFLSVVWVHSDFNDLCIWLSIYVHGK